MVYESSYESGQKPYTPDPKRGYWAVPSDFLYACWAVAFKMEIFSMSWYYFFEMGIYAIIPFLICMVVFVVPIILIQSFLGQFSSSGYISVFRLSPIFKGMGYVSIALNFSILTYFGVYAAVPLIYFLNSLRPTMPWSCEGFEKWVEEVPNAWGLNLCKNMTFDADGNSKNIYQSVWRVYEMPSMIYFRSLFKYQFVNYHRHDFYLSWQLALCMLLVWSGVALIFYKVTDTEKMGKFIRYTFSLLAVLLLICLARLLFLPSAWESLKEFFYPRSVDIQMVFICAPIFTVASFGTGWGNIISLASYNKFQTNIMRLSWLISLGQMLILLLFGLTTFLLDRHFMHITSNSYISIMMGHWVLYLSSGSVLATMEWANMWSLLFYGLLVMSSMLIIVIQFFSMLTAIFDEFEFLRPRRQEVTFGLIGLLALCSLYFCSNHGLMYFTALSSDALFTQTALNLLLLLIVLWIYGRIRFQRDIEFMLGQRFATWRVYVLRFISPLALLTLLFAGYLFAYYDHYTAGFVVGIMAIFFIVIPWLFIPSYAALGLMRASGTFKKRFQRCARPTNWFPVDADDRQRYEEAMGNMDATHQLNEVVADETL